jgi:hypothetical protein
MIILLSKVVEIRKNLGTKLVTKKIQKFEKNYFSNLSKLSNFSKIISREIPRKSATSEAEAVWHIFVTFFITLSAFLQIFTKNVKLVHFFQFILIIELLVQQFDTN